MAVGGDIRSINWTHPTLGSGVFYPKAGEGNTFDPGGIRTNDDAAMIDGSGTVIASKSRVRSELNAVIANDQVTNDSKKASELAGDPLPATYTVSCLNGTTWKTTAHLVGDVKPDLMAATFPIKIAGSEFIQI